MGSGSASGLGARDRVRAAPRRTVDVPRQMRLVGGRGVARDEALQGRVRAEVRVRVRDRLRVRLRGQA